MRPLVGRCAIQMLISRARMVDFIKVCAVVIGWIRRYSILLVRQQGKVRGEFFRRAIAGNARNGQNRATFIQESHFVQG